MEQKALSLPGGVQAVVHVSSEQTDGAFTLITDEAPAGRSLPAHLHLSESETIHVTAGRLWMIVNGGRRVLGPGETIHIPAGVVHEGGAYGDQPVERLLVFAPGGMERFFEALADDPTEALGLAVAHGWRFL